VEAVGGYHQSMMARIYRRGMVRFELGVKSEGVMNGEVVMVKW